MIPNDFEGMITYRKFNAIQSDDIQSFLFFIFNEIQPKKYDNEFRTQGRFFRIECRLTMHTSARD